MESATSNIDNKELNKLRLVFEQTPGAIFILDREFRFEYVNPSFVKLSGYSKEELIGNTVGTLFYNKDLPESRKEIVNSLLKGEKWEGELLTFNKSGSSYWANTLAAPYKDKNDNIDGYVIIQQDITYRKKVENDLRQSEQKYRELTEMLPLTVYELNEKNIPTYINNAGKKLFGLNGEKVDSQAMNFFVSTDRERMSDILKKEKQDAENINHPTPSYPAEYMIQKPDGETVPVLIYGTAIIENGKPAGSRGVIVDISERKAMENALRKSEQKYRELADFLPQTVFELDIDGNLLYVNKSGIEIMGVKDFDFGKSVLKFFVPEDHKRMSENLKVRARENLPTAMNEYTAIKDDGSTFPVIIYVLSVLKNGKPIGTRGIIVDISERKAMENALRESEEKYKTLIENSQDGIFAIVEDKILFANTTFCKMVGYTPDELYNKSAVSLVNPEDRERGLAISERRKKGDFSTINDIFRFVAKDGSLKDGDVFSSVMELNGQRVSYITVHDLTETRKIQEELTKSEQKYRELSEMLPQTVYELDLEANLRYLNKAGREKFGTAYETSDISVFSIVVPDELERMKKNFANVSFKNIPSKGNFYKLKQVDGQIFEAMISATPMVVDGKTVGQRGVVIDITDRIRIEIELQMAKSELEKLNSQLEKRVKESSKRLTEARTQLINLQKENLQSQYDVLKQQVNPHFLFNSLNVLTSLIKLEPDLAEKFSEQLSKVYRYVLENKDNELVDLKTELNFLDAYIFLLNIRFVGKLHVNLNIPDENRNDKIIPLAMQLLIENAIKHNIMSKSNPLVIDIFIDKNNCLNIINNLQERPSQIVSTGVGLKNILNRYKLLELPIPGFEKTKNQFIAKIQLIK